MTDGLDHVALLVASVEGARARCLELGLVAGEIEAFEGEGTRECYVGGPSQSARLLLCEATDPDGPYGRALRKRGPGLHHIALNVSNLNDYIEDLGGSGWLLLPQSLRTIRDGKTAWLARPGIPFLVEVHERSRAARPPFVTKLEVPGGPRLGLRLARLAPASVPWAGLTTSEDERLWISIGELRLAVDDVAKLGRHYE